MTYCQNISNLYAEPTNHQHHMKTIIYKTYVTKVIYLETKMMNYIWKILQMPCSYYYLIIWPRPQSTKSRLKLFPEINFKINFFLEIEMGDSYKES
jgi:hypothetical protein